MQVTDTDTGKRRASFSLRQYLDVGSGFIPYFMVLPIIIIILLIAVYPILDSIRLSLLDNPLIATGASFVGLRNYLQLVSDPQFQSSLGVTALFSVVSVALELGLGLGIAILINDTFPGRGLVRAAVLIPWAFPSLLTARIMSLMFNDRRGMATYILQQLHLLAPGDTLLRTSNGLVIVAIITDVWKATPFMAILILAGLQLIPRELYEAANTDGGNRFQNFWSITLPMITGPLLVALLFRTLDAFRVFDLFYILAGQQVQTLSSYSYYYLFSGSGTDFSRGLATAVLLFVIGLFISMIYLLLMRVTRD